MRIAWAVHGYGRGHATRVSALLPALSERNELLLFAGGDAYDLLAREWPVERRHGPSPAYAGSVLRATARALGDVGVMSR